MRAGCVVKRVGKETTAGVLCEANMRGWYLRRVRAAKGSLCRSGGVTWGYTPEPFALAGSHQIVPLPRRSPHEPADSVARMVAYFRERRARPWSTCGEASTPDAVRRELKVRGFDFVFPGVCMAADLTRSVPEERDDLPEVRITDDLTPEAMQTHPSYGSMRDAGARRSLATSVAMARQRPARVWNFGVIRNGTLIGSLLLHVANGVAGIYDVAVLPAERGRHVATALVRAACRRARDLGLRIAVLQNDASLIPFYAGAGFAVVSRIDHWVYAEEALHAAEPFGARLDAARERTTIAPELFLIAALTGDAAKAERLLREDPSIARTTLRGAGGATPLHLAAYHGAVDAVRMLIGAGGEVTARERRFGGTPLTWAVHALGPDGPVFKRDQVGAAAALIDSGARMTREVREALHKANPDAAGSLTRAIRGDDPGTVKG